MLKTALALLLAASPLAAPVEPDGATPSAAEQSEVAAPAGPAHRAAAKARKAFPGAQGFGVSTPGGRGGRVILVTNLNSGGPGSLRAALKARGKRMVVFRV